MFIVTTLSFDKLAELIRDKQVCLNNADLLFGQDAIAVHSYFRERVGYEGYAMGLRARLNKNTAKLMSSLDNRVNTGDWLILEAEIDESDLLRYNVDGISAAASALAYGLDAEDVIEHLDNSQQFGDNSDSVEVLCVPFIKADGRIKVTSTREENIDIPVEGITFVKMK